MARHFLSLYALVVLAVAVVSWGQERLWLAFTDYDPTHDASLTGALAVIERQLRALPTEGWDNFVAELADDTNVQAELLAVTDIAGKDTLGKLARGDIAYLRAARGDSWLLKQLDAQTILALQYTEPEPKRGALEWSLALLFYAAIALVLMIWLWPLTRDIKRLERATASFGNRNWLFRADIKPRSQIYPLAETFRRMAARIDGLIASHKDMSNAVSHEIKTPLARMQFELEAAQNATDLDAVKRHLGNIKSDIADLNALVRATLDYAILERADMALNLGAHDFTHIIPAVADYVQRDTRPELRIACHVQPDATAVVCDAHLLETVLKNLLYNASRYAKSEIDVSFERNGDHWQLCVDDDGPGIPPADRERVFGSFVQLGQGDGKMGFGLGLAIVKRAIEWHEGNVAALASPAGGARFCVRWPKSLTRSDHERSQGC